MLDFRANSSIHVTDEVNLEACIVARDRNAATPKTIFGMISKTSEFRNSEILSKAERSAHTVLYTPWRLLLCASHARCQARASQDIISFKFSNPLNNVNPLASPAAHKAWLSVPLGFLGFVSGRAQSILDWHDEHEAMRYAAA